MGNSYSKYYTPLPVASSLMSLIELTDNSKVIDICCGSCNLLSTAKQLNAKVECIGVDVSPAETSKYCIIEDDGRTYAINHMSKFDCALANPPFGSSNENSFAELLFVGEYSGITSSRLEVEMLVANLILLKEDGVLLIILPTTIVDGTSTVNVRRTIAARHYVRTIIDMPLNSFYPHKIKCSAIIIEKRKNESGMATQVYRMNDRFELEKAGEIKQDAISMGNWSKRLAHCKQLFSIHQGKISSQMFSQTGEEVLHTGKYAADWQPSIRFMQTSMVDDKVVRAENGDILISRIGASAGQKRVYDGPSKLISDCLLIIKNPTKEVAFNIMQMDMRQLVKGLSTPHITAADIYERYSLLYMR